MKYTGIILLITMQCILLQAQPHKEWKNIYNRDTSTHENTNGLLVNGGYIYRIMPSDRYNGGVGTSDYIPVIQKCDSANNVLWTTVFTHNGANDISLVSLVTDKQQNIYACGYRVAGSPSPVYYGYIVKFDNNGNFVWDRNIDSIIEEGRANKILIDDSNNLYIAGYVINPGFIGQGLLLKLTTDGTEIWRKYTDCFGTTTGSVLLANSNNEFIVNCPDSLVGINAQGQRAWVTDTVTFTYGNDVAAVDKQNNIYMMSWIGYKYSLRKYGPTGNTIWTIDSLNQASGFGDWRMQLLTDDAGNVYACGVNRHWTNDTPFVYKISPQGTIIWDVQLQYDPVSAVLSNGKIFTLGEGLNGLWGTMGITRIDATTGNIDWNIEHNDTTDMRLPELMETDNKGNLYVASRINTSSYTDAALEKYAGIFSELPLGISSLTKANLKIYPNPASNTLIVDGLNKETPVTVYDLSGRDVMRLKLSAMNKDIDITALQPGMYVIKTTEWAGRFVKQ